MKKTTKVELVSALALLIVAAVMMTSASFAWFTIATKAEVKDIQVTMNAYKNVEVAKVSGSSFDNPSEVTPGDAGDETKWGSTITFNSANALEFPATTSGSTIQSHGYDASGRATSLASVSSPSVYTNGVGYYTYDIGYDGTQVTSKAVKVAAAYTFYVRTNAPANGNITTDLNVKVSDGYTVVDADGAYIQGKAVDTTVAATSLVSISVRYATLTNANLGSWTSLTNTTTMTGITVDTTYVVQVLVYINGPEAEAWAVNKGVKVTGLNVEISNPNIT